MLIGILFCISLAVAIWSSCLVGDHADDDDDVTAHPHKRLLFVVIMSWIAVIYLGLAGLIHYSERNDYHIPHRPAVTESKWQHPYSQRQIKDCYSDKYVTLLNSTAGHLAKTIKSDDRPSLRFKYGTIYSCDNVRAYIEELIQSNADVQYLFIEEDNDDRSD